MATKIIGQGIAAPKTTLQSINAAPTASIRGFTDNRVILVRPSDSRCASFWSEKSAGFEKDHDGPTLLIIGHKAADADLGRMVARLSLNIEDLRAFRDAAEGEARHG